MLSGSPHLGHSFALKKNINAFSIEVQLNENDGNFNRVLDKLMETVVFAYKIASSCHESIESTNFVFIRIGDKII